MALREGTWRRSIVAVSSAGARATRGAAAHVHGTATAVWSAYADNCFASRRHEPARPGDGRPDAVSNPHDPPRWPELPGRALARPGTDPVERLEPSDLPA